MRRTLLVVALVLTACGAASEGPSPKDASHPPEPAAMPTAPAAPAPSTDTPGAAPETSAEIPQVLQVVLDDPELEPYLRLDKPERFPVKVSGPGLAPGLELSKGGKPVEVLLTCSENEPVITFTKIDVSADKAAVTYRYDVENLRGSCSLAKRDGVWQLTRSRLVQH
ncbi:MAG: hypothetical protein JW940_12245 [Polyangiaceae bacterium]|nr:hypothetical protein [Polyangiaceae bacterium]